jgi:hypothetical protein
LSDIHAKIDCLPKSSSEFYIEKDEMNTKFLRLRTHKGKIARFGCPDQAHRRITGNKDNAARLNSKTIFKSHIVSR